MNAHGGVASFAAFSCTLAILVHTEHADVNYEPLSRYQA